MNLRPEARYGPVARFQWGLFAGTKSDLADPATVQPVARQMNLHAGINLNKIHQLALDFADPPQGFGSPYMDRAAVRRLMARLRQDKGYIGRLSAADPYSRDLLAMWADESGQGIAKVGRSIRDKARAMLQAMVHDDGIYSFGFHYWHGGLEMSRMLVWIDQVLGSEQSAIEDKSAARAAAVLFAATLWDNDFVPMDNHAGINLGTPNMPVQQSGFRNQYAVALARHPMMLGRVEQAVEATAKVLATDINDHGAHLACPHYVGAGMGPTLMMMQQLQAAGVKDLFRDEPKVAKFAEFYMNCATPPEVRFGGVRGLISVGDGPTAPSELLGVMGTGFAASNPILSRRLMALWQSQGRPHSSFHGTTILRINEDLPDRKSVV